MTVMELIERLWKCNPEASVKLELKGYDGNYEDLTAIVDLDDNETVVLCDYL